MQLDKIQNTSPKIPELIMQSLIGAIEAGHIHVGEELPSERELAESLGVGRGSLRECLAMGADEAYLLSDRAFGGADTCATAETGRSCCAMRTLFKKSVPGLKARTKWTRAGHSMSSDRS